MNEHNDLRCAVEYGDRGCMPCESKCHKHYEKCEEKKMCHKEKKCCGHGIFDDSYMWIILIILFLVCCCDIDILECLCENPCMLILLFLVFYCCWC